MFFTDLIVYFAPLAVVFLLFGWRYDPRRSVCRMKYYTAMTDRLARVTTSGRRIRELDGLRFIAIASVVIQHVFIVVSSHSPADVYQNWFIRLVRDWRIGVELFFVISGFILALPFAGYHLLGRKPVKLKEYYWRRVTRLEPPYLLTLLLWYLVLIFYWHESARALLPHLLASAVYLHNIIYFHTGEFMSRINSVAWSLEIEVQFYILAPLLAAVFMIRPAVLRRAVLIVASLIVSQTDKLFQRHGLILPPNVFTELPLFFMGFLLADVYLTDWKSDPKQSTWFDLIAIPGWLLLPFWFHFIPGNPHPIFPTSSFPVILLILCWASFRSRFTRAALASSFIMTVGGMCYSIYLLHFPLIKILGNYSPLLPGNHLATNTLIYFFLWGTVVLAVSVAFFLLIEKPCMQRDWPQRLAAKLQGESIPIEPLPAGIGQAERLLDVPSPGAVGENQPAP